MNTARMKKAAFKTGDRLRYIGDRKAWAEVKGKQVPIIYNGMEVEIIKTKLPTAGLGFVGNDADGEPIFDQGSDGYNVYNNANGDGRIIWPDNAADWQKVN